MPTSLDPYPDHVGHRVLTVRRDYTAEEPSGASATSWIITCLKTSLGRKPRVDFVLRATQINSVSSEPGLAPRRTKCSIPNASEKVSGVRVRKKESGGIWLSCAAMTVRF